MGDLRLHEVWLTAPGAPVDSFAVDAPVGSRSGGGQVGASATARSSTVVTWFDSSRGRHLLTRDGDGITIVPSPSVSPAC